MGKIDLVVENRNKLIHVRPLTCNHFDKFVQYLYHIVILQYCTGDNETLRYMYTLMSVWLKHEQTVSTYFIYTVNVNTYRITDQTNELCHILYH